MFTQKNVSYVAVATQIQTKIKMAKNSRERNIETNMKKTCRKKKKYTFQHNKLYITIIAKPYKF